MSLKRVGSTALPVAYTGGSQAERASAGTTTFNNTLLGVSAGTEGGLLDSTVGYTRDPAGGLGIRGQSWPITASLWRCSSRAPQYRIRASLTGISAESTQSEAHAP